MARYLEVAAQANVVAKQLMELVPDVDNNKARAAELVARLVNFGVRCAPRAVHGTVRLNAVKRAVQDLPVRVSMEEKKDERTGRTYKVLVTQQLVAGKVASAATVEDGSDEE